MKGVMEFLASPVMFLVVGALIALLVAIIIFSIDPDALIGFMKGFAPK